MALDYEKHVAIDFETFYSDEYSVSTMGPHNYTKDPRFDAYILSAYCPEFQYVGHPSGFDWKLLSGRTVVAHNALFEWYILDALGVEIDFTLVDSAGVCRYMNVAGSLKDAIFGLYGETRDKTIRDDAMKGRHWHQFTPDEQHAINAYALQDSVDAWTIWDDFGSEWPEKEYRVWLQTCHMLRRGVRVDVAKLDSYVDILANEYHRCLSLMPWVEAGEKPGSPKAVKECCRDNGVPIPKSFNKKENDVKEWVEVYGEKFPWVQAFQDHKSVNQFRNKLLSLRNRLDGDTLHYDLIYAGTRTLRWAGRGAESDTSVGGYNILTMRKDAMFGCDERSLIIPRDGKKFIIADWAQIEPRILFVRVDKQSLLKLIRQGMSVYEAYARATGNWDRPEDLKSGDPKLYATFKAIVLGLGYGMGHEKFVSSSGLDMPLPEAKDLVRRYRYVDNPEIQALWYEFGDEMTRYTGASVYRQELPSGRPIFYYNVEVSATNGNIIVPKELGLSRLDYYWGGKLVENYIQSVARDILVETLLGGWGEDIVLHIYDEAVFEVDIDVPVPEIVEYMCRPVEWLPDLPLDAEAIESYCYTK